MIDLHTHILCGVDDGAVTAEDSLRLLQMEWEQGVTTVVLSPHFYRDRQRPEAFFAQRDAALKELNAFLASLPQEQQDRLPQILVGAEVAWRPNLPTWEDLDRFCIQGTRNMLLELPFVPWDQGLCNQIYDLMNRGITPILVHLERYLSLQKKKQVNEILSMGVPVQISSSLFLQKSAKRKALKALKTGWAHVVASDCHDDSQRKPDLGDAMAVIADKFGEGFVQSMNGFAESLLEA